MQVHTLPQRSRIARLADLRLCLSGFLDSYKTAPYNSDQRERLQLAIDETREEIAALSSD